ncbi:hypothetical protein PG990_014681 [Apiospora arundinis]
MSQCGLHFVRKDADHVVYTQHPDYIHPRDLSRRLVQEYGGTSFRISLRRNIYVVYVNNEVAKCDQEAASGMGGADDIEAAQEVLIKANRARCASQI